ncbi:MAG: 30S ribosomal protein S16 [Phycisphaerales bacterium]|nr:30S ribosomal protein S16 [Phycisphaerales bacterium]
MVVLRLKRYGRTHSPFYRLAAADRRSPTDGRVIEELGWFSPTAREGKQWKLDAPRVTYWLSVGAQPSETVLSLLHRAEITNTVGPKGKASLSATHAKARRNAPKKAPPAEPAAKS